MSNYKPVARTSNVSILRQLSSNCSYLNRKDKTSHYKKASLDSTKNNTAIKSNIKNISNINTINSNINSSKSNKSSFINKG